MSHIDRTNASQSHYNLDHEIEKLGDSLKQILMCLKNESSETARWHAQLTDLATNVEENVSMTAYRLFRAERL